MEKTRVVTCTCKSEFQDAIYGNKQRVTTPVNKEQGKKNFVVRCTVCAKEHTLGTMR